MDSIILLDTPPADAEFDDYIHNNDQDIHEDDANLNHIMETEDDDNQISVSPNRRQSYDTMEINNIIGTGSFDYNQIKTESYNYMDDYQCVQPAIEMCADESEIPYDLMDIPFDRAVEVGSTHSTESEEEHEIPLPAVKEEAELNISNYVEVEEFVHVADHQVDPCDKIKSEFPTESVASVDEAESLSPPVSEEQHSAELESIMSDHNYSNQPDEIEQSNSQPISASQDVAEPQQNTTDMSLNDLLLLIQPKASALPQDGQLELLSLVTTLLTDEKLPIEVILSDIVRSANALKSQFSTELPSERNDTAVDEIVEEQADPRTEPNSQKQLLPENEPTDSDFMSSIPECASNLPLPEEVVHSSCVGENPDITSSAEESFYSEGHSEPAEYNPPAELLGTIPNDEVDEPNVPPPLATSQDSMASAGDEVDPVNPLSMCLEKLNMFGQNLVVRNAMLLRDLQTNCRVAKEIPSDIKICSAFITSLDSDFKDLIKEFKLATGLSKPVAVKVERTAEEKAEAARKLNEKSKARWLASSSSDNDSAGQHDDSRDSPVIMKRKKKRQRFLSTESSEIVKPQETDCQADDVPPVVQKSPAVQTPPLHQIDEEMLPSDELAESLAYEDSTDSNNEAIGENEVEVGSNKVRTIEDINNDLGLNEGNEDVGGDIPADSQASLDLSKYHASQFSSNETESIPSPNPVEMNTYDEMEEDEVTVKNEYLVESQAILPVQSAGAELVDENSNAESVDYEPSDDEFHGFDKDIPFDDNVKMELGISAETIREFDTIEDGNSNDANLDSIANPTDVMNQQQHPIIPSNDFGEYFLLSYRHFIFMKILVFYF